jgi:probable HAF family extracellular repeat protein
MRRVTLLLAGFTLLASVASASSAGGTQAEARWVITDLGTLGGPESEAAAINEHGQVVGWGDTTASDVLGDPVPHAFLWQQGKLTDLGALGSLSESHAPKSHASGINDRGQVVGDSTSARSGFVAFLWQRGKMTVLRGMSDDQASAYAINNSSQIVGQNHSQSDAAFLWRKGKMTLICPPGTDDDSPSTANDINEHGQVVGGCEGRAFLWQTGHRRKLGAMVEASGINDGGQVVGGLWPNYRAVMWRNGRVTAVAGRGSEARAINNLGQIVGSISIYSKGGLDVLAEYPCLWEKGKLTRLAGLGGKLSAAHDLNDRGQIVGWAQTKTGDRHAVLWMLRRGT